jgi:polysaccharide deacetylase family protein (PEP-CTERM system associated)
MNRSQTMRNALTVDLEDWYHAPISISQKVEGWPQYEDRVVESTGRVLEILAGAGVRATFFVLGYVADRFPDLIRRVANEGHEIGLHGYHHRRVSALTPKQFRAELQRGREAVEKAGGQAIVGHRAPMFSINGSSLWALEVLRDEGFCYDSSVFPTRNMLYGYPDAPRGPYRPFDGHDFVEFPLSTVRIMGVNWPIAGGFYLRFLPYRAFKWGLEKLNREGMPANIYLHPWELDPDHPRPHLTRREQFTHYYHLDQTATKLTALLADFRFGPLIDLVRASAQRGATSAYASQGVAGSR